MNFRLIKYTANAISLSRVVLLFVWVYLRNLKSVWSIAAILLIISTDIIDGAVARKLRTDGVSGAIMDTACDISVILGACMIIGRHTPCYFTLIGFMIISLLSWAAYCLSLGRLTYSAFGKLNGAVCYAAILTATITQVIFSTRTPPGTIIEISTAVFAMAYLLISIAMNVAGLRRQLLKRNKCVREYFLPVAEKLFKKEQLCLPGEKNKTNICGPKH